MKKTAIILLCTLLSLSAICADEDVEARLKNLNSIIDPSPETGTLKRINTLLRAKTETEKMIGRSATFFPIFDHYLKIYNLPEDLRYITCLETELNNRVVSTSGAKGIWQLMPDVKEEFGLRIDGTLDERLDLHRGTEAALKDLKRMYERYKDWQLVLAGYNCGVGRLGAAMKRARSNDFNEIKKYLPQQTQDYIPKFIAFTYVMKNYRAHGLKPKFPNFDIQTIGSVKVYNYLSLQTVASITGLPYEMVKALNQQYGEEHIPENTAGLNLTLPRRVLGAVNEYLSHVDVKTRPVLNFSPIVIDENIPKHDEDPNYFKTTYYVGEGETLESLAELFNIGAYNIMLWNNMDTPSVSKGKELTLYLPRVIPKRV